MRALLTCVYQSTRNSSETTRDAARQVAEAVGAQRHAVARAIESEDDFAGVAGTIAGDDTVLVAVATADAAERVRSRVEELL